MEGKDEEGNSVGSPGPDLGPPVRLIVCWLHLESRVALGSCPGESI